MGKGIGRAVNIGLKKEAVRGTAETTADLWVRTSDLVIDEMREVLFDESTIGTISDSMQAKVVKEWVEGSFTMPLTRKSSPLILAALIGGTSASAAAGETTIYDHTFVVMESAQHQALTIFVNDPLGGQDYKYANGMIKSVEVKYGVGKYPEMKVDFIAQKGTTATLTTSFTTADTIFRPQDLTFKKASAVGGLSGATAIPLKSASIKVEVNVESDDVLGTVTPADFLNKHLVITGSLEALWANESDFRTTFNAGTAQAIQLKLIDLSTLMGVASTTPKLEFTFPQAYFQSLTRAMKLNDFVAQTLAFKAVYDMTTSKQISGGFTNDVASYA